MAHTLEYENEKNVGGALSFFLWTFRLGRFSFYQRGQEKELQVHICRYKTDSFFAQLSGEETVGKGQKGGEDDFILRRSGELIVQKHCKLWIASR